MSKRALFLILLILSTWLSHSAWAAAPIAPPADANVSPPPMELDEGAFPSPEATSPNGLSIPEPEKKKSFDNSRTDSTLYNKTVSEKGRVKSIFYSPAEVKDVYLAVNTYLKNIGRGGDLTFDEEAFLRRLSVLKRNTANNTKTQSRFFTYPQFFLDSLVYYSASDWLVWINGEKITQATPLENNTIRVIEINADRVTVQWFPVDMDRVIEVWKKYPNDSVQVDETRGQVVFSLKPNQTFSSYLMKPLEGRVLPVTIDVGQGAPPAEIFPADIEDEMNAPIAVPEAVKEEVPKPRPPRKPKVKKEEESQ